MAPPPTATAKYLLITVAVVLLAADLRFVSSQGASPPPATDCMAALTGLVDCLSYVQNGSTLTKPDPACCTELSNLVSTQPACLCQLAANANQIGIPIDLSRAISLPGTCKVTFSLSVCTAGGSTIASPPTEGPSAGPVPFTPASTQGSPAGAPESSSRPSDSSSSTGNNSSILVGLTVLMLSYFFQMG